MKNQTISSSLLGHSPLFRLGGAILSAVGQKISGAVARYRTRSALHKLDDFLLKDIGITRADIDRVATTGRLTQN